MPRNQTPNIAIFAPPERAISMIVGTVTMTPAMAKSLLAGNDNNRNLVEARIGMMAAQMKAGSWRLNGETVIVSDTGRLLDGQHRLAAVIVANTDVPMIIARGASDTVFNTIDTGRTRKTSDIVGLAGNRHRYEISAGAQNLYKMMSGVAHQVSLPPSYAIEMIERFPSLDGWADRYKHSKGVRALIGAGSILPALAYLSDIAERPELAATLLDGLSTGQNLSSGSPVLALRNRLISLRAKSHTMNIMTCWGAVVRTIDAMESGEPLFKVSATRTTSTIAQPARYAKHFKNIAGPKALEGLPRPAVLRRIRNQSDLMNTLVHTPEERAAAASAKRSTDNQKRSLTKRHDVELMATA